MKISMKERFDLIYESNKKLLQCISNLIEQGQDLTARINMIEEKELSNELETGANITH